MSTRPIPYCKHGYAFTDHSGEWLVMDCGCQFPKDWNRHPRHDVMRKALEGVLHHNDAVKLQYQLPKSLIEQVRAALEVNAND